jgi:phosphate uptake regulator
MKSVRSTFETDIQQLKDELLTLGSIVEQQILNAVAALENRDFEGSKLVKETDIRSTRVVTPLNRRC